MTRREFETFANPSSISRYLGLAVPDFPNMLLFIGPTWPVENGSVMGPLHTVSDYAIQIIKKMQNENVRSWVPKQDIVSTYVVFSSNNVLKWLQTDRFNDHVQVSLRSLCHSWPC